MKKTLRTVFVSFAFLAACLTLLSFNVLADSATGNFSISSAAPTMGDVTLWNQLEADAAITLSAGSTVTVIANVTVTDLNGGDDISSATATLYHSTNVSGDSDDENTHLTNSSCVLGATDGNTKVATCRFTMNYMALGGTWTANITATDSSALSVSNTDDNTVNDLAALDVTDATINFGSLALGANSSSESTMTVRSQGNVQIDARFSGNDFTCTSGTVPVGNVRYSLSTGNYDSMSDDLTTSPATQTTFDLGVRGVATADGANSDNSEYWTIKAPVSGVAGVCTNTLTVAAIAG